MQQRQLGTTDLQLTTIGLGTWAIGGPWQFGWGTQDDDEAIAAILAALDSGINWIDTAPIYGLGHSEKLIAQALKQTKIKPFIATKCGLLWNEKKEKVNCLETESLKKECHDSLRRLGVDTIDLYQMHWPQPTRDIEQAWAQMAKLKKEGKVRYIGVSNFNIEQLKRIQKIAPVSSTQPPYSMIQQGSEGDLLGYCSKNNIGIITYSPLQKGLLTGKFSKEYLAGLDEGDHRKKDPDFQEPKFSATLILVEKLHNIARQNKLTIAQLAISWVLANQKITSVIVGARNPNQITETAKASEKKLSAKDIRQIEQLLAQRETLIHSAKK